MPMLARGCSVKPCQVSSCSRPSRTRGWCTMHYCKWRRNGDPLGGSTPKGASLDWLQRAVSERDRTTCWQWPFASSSGYGHFVWNGRPVKATHAALELDGRPRPASPDDNALHSCDNPPCVNPAHLRWGSFLDNSSDQRDRDRDRLPRGERSGMAVLTEAQVLEIYDRWVPGRRGNASVLAAEYGVSRSAIRFIGIGQSWAWLTQRESAA
jgi:hypothetical protein